MRKNYTKKPSPSTFEELKKQIMLILQETQHPNPKFRSLNEIKSAENITELDEILIELDDANYDGNTGGSHYDNYRKSSVQVEILTTIYNEKQGLINESNIIRKIKNSVIEVLKEYIHVVRAQEKAKKTTFFSMLSNHELTNKKIADAESLIDNIQFLSSDTLILSNIRCSLMENNEIEKFNPFQNRYGNCLRHCLSKIEEIRSNYFAINPGCIKIPFTKEAEQVVRQKTTAEFERKYGASVPRR